MFQKIGESIGLLKSNLMLFGLIVLTVWLPGNLLINYYVAYYIPQSETQAALAPIRMSMWIEGIFGPIYIGAMIYALSRIKQGQAVTYSEAIGVGFRNWGRLFAARFVAGLIIMLGLLALIIPGIYLSLRYALLDSAVVLEGAGVGQSRARSAKLTEGRKLEILGVAVAINLGIAALSIMIYLPVVFVQPLNTMPAGVVVDSILDIAHLVITIAMFLYYWEARQQELGATESPFAGEASPFAIGEVQAQLQDAPDDENPYRSPKF
jgi:hypothetical protein